MTISGACRTNIILSQKAVVLGVQTPTSVGVAARHRVHGEFTHKEDPSHGIP